MAEPLSLPRFQEITTEEFPEITEAELTGSGVLAATPIFTEPEVAAVDVPIEFVAVTENWYV